ncbi:CinA family protein [Catenulispora subtropica]|uniref:CinA family protein n=1 Tax=Catenulispora subtropica TaxID=450798 RepID=A0ABN2SUZ7_9ACTN
MERDEERGVNAEQIAAAARSLVGGATEVGRTIAVAESLTGGLVAAAITAVPGASAVFRGSVTAYATDAKASVLGVDAALLAREGAVDAEVARQMATGVRRLFGAEVGLATTGVAGPTEQDGKPVGLVYVACSFADFAPVAVELRLDGDRETIRAETVLRTLALGLSTFGH